METRNATDSSSGDGGMAAASLIAAAAAKAGRGVAAMYRGLISDGAIGRAGRQGLDELGQALVAFPESIEAGGYEAYPSPGDIAHGRDVANVHGQTPDNGHVAEQGKEQKHVHGERQAESSLPGDIAKEPSGNAPERQGREMGQERGRER